MPNPSASAPHITPHKENSIMNSMNATVSTTPGRHDHPPHAVEVHRQHPVRRVSLLDRAALHLGVALVKWSRRPYLDESRVRLARERQQYLARLDRERAAARLLHLNVPH
jgi:hypothetical protein